VLIINLLKESIVHGTLLVRCIFLKVCPSGTLSHRRSQGMAISLIFICFNQSLDLMTISKNTDHKVKGDNLKLSNKFIHAFSNLIKTLLDYRSKNGISKKLKTMKFDEYSSEFDRDIREKMNGKGKNDG
jgi:hypothetical protein